MVVGEGPREVGGGRDLAGDAAASGGGFLREKNNFWRPSLLFAHYFQYLVGLLPDLLLPGEVPVPPPLPLLPPHVAEEAPTPADALGLEELKEVAQDAALRTAVYG